MGVDLFVQSNNAMMNKFLKYPRIIIILCGAWPTNKTKWSNIYKIYEILVGFIFFGCTMSGSIDLYYSLNSVNSFFEALFTIIPTWIGTLKYVQYLCKKQYLKEIIKSLGNPLFTIRRPAHLKIYENWSKTIIKYCRPITLQVCMAVILLGLAPILRRRGEANIELPFRGWFPFDVDKSTGTYVFAYWFQNMSMWYIGTFTASQAFLLCVLMNIGCCQTAILKDYLKNSIEYASMNTKLGVKGIEDVDPKYYTPLTEEVEKELMIILKRCVEMHNAINRLFFNIEQFFNPALLIQLMADSSTICVSILQLTMVPFMGPQFMSRFEYIMSISALFSVICWNGDYVITETSTIIDSCYFMDWHRCTPRIRKILMIIMENSKYPNSVKAGIFELSRTTLLAVGKTTYSFITVLRKFMKE